MTLVSELRSKFNKSCFVNAISRTEGGKRRWIDLSDVKGNHAVIDFDAPDLQLRGHETRPDFLVVCDVGGSAKSANRSGPELLYPIEISTGRSKSASKIRNQLQAGADWANSQIGSCNPMLIPVYLGRIKPLEKDKIRKGIEKVNFRGSKQIIQLASNGKPLPKPDLKS